MPGKVQSRSEARFPSEREKSTVKELGVVCHKSNLSVQPRSAYKA